MKIVIITFFQQHCHLFRRIDGARHPRSWTRYKADDIMDAILAVLKDWKISSRIVALVFDTTNVNSGANTGVAVQLEKSGSSSWFTYIVGTTSTRGWCNRLTIIIEVEVLCNVYLNKYIFFNSWSNLIYNKSRFGGAVAATIFDSKSPENDEFKPLIKSWTLM